MTDSDVNEHDPCRGPKFACNNLINHLLPVCLERYFLEEKLETEVEVSKRDGMISFCGWSIALQEILLFVLHVGLHSHHARSAVQILLSFIVVFETGNLQWKTFELMNNQRYIN